MQKVTQIFSNREISLAVWMVILFSGAMLKKEVRDSFLNVVKIFFDIKIFRIYFLMTVYVVSIVLLLNHFGLWNLSLLKDTIYWYFGIAFVSLFNANKINKEEDYFKKLFISYLKLVAVLEFISNLYSYGLVVELILVPVFLFIVLISAVSSTKKEYQLVEKVFNILLSIIGLLVMVYTFTKIVSNINSFANIDTLTSFFVSPVLTFVYLPFIYCFLLFLSYETLFLRLKYFIKDTNNIMFVKWKILFSFHFRLRELNRFAKEYALLSEENDDDIVTVIKVFKGKVRPNT